MMMELSGDIPVTLIIKAPNQHMADQTVDCMLGWTIQKLKQHLENVYPTKPKHNEQRLIYSGRLLQDHLTLKDVLRQYDSSLLSQHTVHLVCSSVSDTSPSASTSFAAQRTLPASASTSTGSMSSESSSVNTSVTGQYKSHVHLSEPIRSPGYGSGYAEYQRSAMIQGDMASYTPEQYAWIMQQQQQVYSQYMMQYMMYYQNLYNPAMSFNHMMPPTFQQQTLHPQQPQAQEAPAANNGAQQEARRQNVRMNAQGGMEEDDEDEGEPRDWLHHMYFFMRVLTFMGILFFYSNLTRFLTVCAGSLAVYFLQKFRKYMQRAQQQQQPVQEQQNNQQQEVQQPDIGNQEAPDVQDQTQPDGTSDQQQPIANDNSQIRRMATFACNTVQSFFTSLLPTPAERLDRN